MDLDAPALPWPLPPPNRANVREEIEARADTVATRGTGKRRLGPAERRELSGPEGRVAIVAGCRTPFARAGSTFKAHDVVDLAAVAAGELVARAGLSGHEIDLAVMGATAPAPNAPNLGREVVLRCSLPPTIPGVTVNSTCASSCRAMTFGAQSLLAGESRVVLAGGAESMSNVPVTYSRNAAQLFQELGKARTVKARLAVLAKLRLKDLAPVPPAVAEHSTGRTLGEACELMAKENDVSRAAQDEWALVSHQRAEAARRAGWFAGQIVPTFALPERRLLVEADTAVRPGTSAAALAALAPAFDDRFGTVTAGNSSPYGDGGAALLLMGEERARALGYEPLGYLRSFAFVAVDPAAQLLQGPAWAVPLALDRAGMALADVDLVELHEAFGAQVVSNLKALASRRFAREELGREEPVGVVDLDRLNVAGGSLAFAHPMAATGARLVLQLLSELRRRGLGVGLAATCAAGGIGFAAVLERGR